MDSALQCLSSSSWVHTQNSDSNGRSLRIKGVGLPFKQLGHLHRGHLKTERSAYYNCECHFPSTLYSFLGNEAFSRPGPDLGTILTCHVYV